MLDFLKKAIPPLSSLRAQRKVGVLREKHGSIHLIFLSASSACSAVNLFSVKPMLDDQHKTTRRWSAGKEKRAARGASFLPEP